MRLRLTRLLLEVAQARAELVRRENELRQGILARLSRLVADLLRGPAYWSRVTRRAAQATVVANVLVVSGAEHEWRQVSSTTF
ncbi:hypothetical protein CWO91_15285 [Bradyrhizobium genosp. SA-3]|nr:hypothetical protein CWO91_15285 [Bradyrhizobium genosp. SA-3]